ncbi:MAG TPA: helix-hairpin-helix domain-containing protein, partial [Roseiflexaceae bacterium]|nr:helix-hairpin-helix domain-containing protein [Roseiflexaceae bacterium]
MDLDQKLDILSPAARFDACDSFSQGGKRYTPKKAIWNEAGIAADGGPDGRARPVFRTLMSSKCEWNCTYCPLRSGSDTPRAALTPEELAKVFLPRFEKGAVQGLFLSTGVDGGAHAATGQMLDGVEHLRKHHGYTGYVHLKLLPGAALSEVERAARLADRLSLNLEAPSAERLARVSPDRDWAGDLITRLAWARDWQREGLLKSGLATQFVVGAAGESDRELLLTTTWLYRELELRRVYFGAFRPAPGTPLEDHLPTPFVREQRLKEADWLLRHYGFVPPELPYDPAGDLPLHIDPKLAWALAHPERFPIELNTADQELLLCVPGLGPLSIRRIIRLRREGRFRDPAQLKGLGGVAARARDFVTFDGRFFGRDLAARLRHYAPRGPLAEQLTLW